MDGVQHRKLSRFGLSFNLLKSLTFLSWIELILNSVKLIGCALVLIMDVDDYLRGNYQKMDFLNKSNFESIGWLDWAQWLLYIGFMWKKCWKLLNLAKEKNLEDIGITLKDIILISACSKWISTGFSSINFHSYGKSGDVENFRVITQICFLLPSVIKEDRGNLKWYLCYEYFVILVHVLPVIIETVLSSARATFSLPPLYYMLNISHIFSTIYYSFKSGVGFVIILDGLFYNREIRTVSSNNHND